MQAENFPASVKGRRLCTDRRYTGVDIARLTARTKWQVSWREVRWIGAAGDGRRSVEPVRQSSNGFGRG